MRANLPDHSATFSIPVHFHMCRWSLIGSDSFFVFWYFIRFIPFSFISPFKSFRSLPMTKSQANSRYVMNACAHQMREFDRFHCVSSTRNTWSAHMISLFIYLVLVRWCAKVHFLIFFFLSIPSLLSYVFELVSVCMCAFLSLSPFLYILSLSEWWKRNKTKNTKSI